jgi:hypothetical protein
MSRVLRIVDGLTDVFPSLVSLLGSGFLMRFSYVLRRVFCVAPCLLGCAFGLVNNSFVG